MQGELAAMVVRYHESIDAFVRGDAEVQKPLFSHRGDATLANPLGPPARGWKDVESMLDRAASGVRDGEPMRFERVSEFETPDLAYILEIERGRAKFGESDEAVAYALRVTTIFRREAGDWKIVHRHADPITSPRRPESVVGS